MTSASDTDTGDDLTLYYHQYCGFCSRVLSALQLLGVDIELRNVRETPAYRQELIDGGGEAIVPCLHIANGSPQGRWMYESQDIIDYLSRRFTPSETD